MLSLRLFDESGALVNIKQGWLWLGVLPADAAPPLGPETRALVAAWIAAVEAAAERFWRTVEYPDAVLPQDVTAGVPGPVSLVASHLAHGPVVPRAAPIAPIEARPPVRVRVAGPRAAPSVTFEAGTDTVELEFLPYLDLQVVVRTPEGALVALRRWQGRLDIVDRPAAEVRAVLQWLAAAARSAGDPVLRVADPDDRDEEPELHLFLLSLLLDELASTARLDWRIEPDFLAKAGALPIDGSDPLLWTRFLDRHFSRPVPPLGR